MSQETPTDLPEMPIQALSLSEVDQRSASRMLRVLVIFGWGMAAAVVVSALLGFGTPLSNTLAFCWFAALTLLLLLCSKLTLQWHRGVALAMVCLVIARWAVAWLYADAADAMVGVVTGACFLSEIEAELQCEPRRAHSPELSVPQATGPACVVSCSEFPSRFRPRTHPRLWPTRWQCSSAILRCHVAAQPRQRRGRKAHSISPGPPSNAGAGHRGVAKFLVIGVKPSSSRPVSATKIVERSARLIVSQRFAAS